MATEDLHSASIQEIPHILQGEIARLDQKFKISIDSSAQVGTKVIKLVCCLDDKYLPCVPPVSVVIPGMLPLQYLVVSLTQSITMTQTKQKHLLFSCIFTEDYPFNSPSCSLIEDEYNATPFLSNILKALVARIGKLPKLFSLSHLLDTWEMSVRQACSPVLVNTNTPSVGVLLGI